MSTSHQRAVIHELLDAGLRAVEPERLTVTALSVERGKSATLIAIGKAAAAMCRGAAQVFTSVEGVCITNHRGVVTETVELVIGDHPLPGDASFAAGRRMLNVASAAEGPIIALISGGGSALCEHPIDGVSRGFISETTGSSSIRLGDIPGPDRRPRENGALGLQRLRHLAPLANLGVVGLASGQAEHRERFNRVAIAATPSGLSC